MELKTIMLSNISQTLRKTNITCFSLMCRAYADLNVFGYMNVCLGVGDEVRKGVMNEKEGILKEVGEEKILEHMAWKHTVERLGERKETRKRALRV